jgi:hypothetical protein
MAKSKWTITERIPLSTKALDQRDRSYSVELQMDGYGHWIVALLGTPGSWRFNDIENRSNLAIDLGSGWGWTNVEPVIAEAKAILDAREEAAAKKTPAQLDREIAEALARRPGKG